MAAANARRRVTQRNERRAACLPLKTGMVSRECTIAREDRMVSAGLAGSIPAAAAVVFVHAVADVDVERLSLPSPCTHRHDSLAHSSLTHASLCLPVVQTVKLDVEAGRAWRRFNSLGTMVVNE